MAGNRALAKRRTRFRIRKKISGTEKRPRIAVYRSMIHIYLQAFDDINGLTLAHASTLDPQLRKKLKGKTGNIKAAEAAGNLMAERLKKKGLKNIVFDRGGFVYHGRVKAAAEAMRKTGIEF